MPPFTISGARLIAHSDRCDPLIVKGGTADRPTFAPDREAAAQSSEAELSLDSLEVFELLSELSASALLRPSAAVDWALPRP